MIEREYVKWNTSIQTGSNAAHPIKDEDGNLEATIAVRFPDDLFQDSYRKRIQKIEMEPTKLRLSMENTPIAQLPLDEEKSSDTELVSTCQLDVWPFCWADDDTIKPELLANTAFPYYKSKSAGVNHRLNLCFPSNLERFEKTPSGQILIQKPGTLEQILQDALENALTWACVDNTGNYINVYLTTGVKPKVTLSEQTLSIAYDTAPFLANGCIPILWNQSFIENFERPQPLKDQLPDWYQPPPKRAFSYAVTNGTTSFSYKLPEDWNACAFNIIANKAMRDTFSFLPWLKIDTKKNASFAEHPEIYKPNIALDDDSFYCMDSTTLKVKMEGPEPVDIPRIVTTDVETSLSAQPQARRNVRAVGRFVYYRVKIIINEFHNTQDPSQMTDAERYFKASDDGELSVVPPDETIVAEGYMTENGEIMYIPSADGTTSVDWHDTGDASVVTSYKRTFSNDPDLVPSGPTTVTSDPVYVTGERTIVETDLEDDHPPQNSQWFGPAIDWQESYTSYEGWQTLAGKISHQTYGLASTESRRVVGPVMNETYSDMDYYYPPDSAESYPGGASVTYTWNLPPEGTFNYCIYYAHSQYVDDTRTKKVTSTTTTVAEQQAASTVGNIRMTYTWDNLPIVVMSPISSIVLSLGGIYLTSEIQPINPNLPSGSSLTQTIPIVENYYSLASTLRDLHDELVISRQNFDDNAKYGLEKSAGTERLITLGAKYITKDGRMHQLYIPPNGVFAVQLTFRVTFFTS